MSESTSVTSEASTEHRHWLGLARSASQSMGPSGREFEPERTRDLLVFGLSGSFYAIGVEQVREILRMRPLTSVPRSPDWLVGVVPLRGEVVQVVDLRRRLGLPHTTPDRANRIVVLHGEADQVTAMTVDFVRDVVRVPEDAIQATTGLGLAAVVEICEEDGDFISIIDVDVALGLDDG